jgi:dipeptidyl aminopeptidase/acylaminoacyl peptidase
MPEKTATREASEFPQASPLRAEDIGRIRTVESPVLSPDGRRIAYTVTQVDAEANTYRSALWLASTDATSSPRQLTSGRHLDRAPSWSPDGTTLAFVSNRGDEPRMPHTLHTIPVEGPGEIVTLDRRDEAFETISWSPDGRRLLFVSRVRDGGYDVVDETARPPRRVDRLFSRSDGIGWTSDRPRQVFVIEAAGYTSARQVTDKRVDVHSPTWAPDGVRIACVAALHDDADLGMENDIWILEVDAPEKPWRKVTQTDAVFFFPSFDEGGTRLAFLQRRGPNGGRIGHRHARLAVVDLADDVRTVLTAGLDRHCTIWGVGQRPIWIGTTLYVGVEDEGRGSLLAVGLDSTVSFVDKEQRVLTGFDVRDGVIAFTATRIAMPSELYVRVGEVERRASNHQDEFVRSFPPIPAERFEVISEDGETVDAWIMRPAGYEPGTTYPCILNIHGGPWTQYGESWFDEFQLYASAGFAVLFSNPHGSTGYAESFARKILSGVSSEDPGTGWGGLDFSDMMAVVDAAIDRFDFVDPERLGVMGGSYGGWATSWTITHTNRFAAACSERAINNHVSADWSSDMGGVILKETGVDALVHPEELVRMSPLTYVRDIETPVLIVHSEGDLRCHIEQADALFVNLRRLGKEVEYWRFPGESHDLSRTGSPAHRIQRAELIIDWFSRKL